MSGREHYKLDFFEVTFPKSHVAHVEIDRGDRYNAFLECMFENLKTIFDRLSSDRDVHAVILSGIGDKAFTSGLDTTAAFEEGPLAQINKYEDPASAAFDLRRHILKFQACVSAIEKCEKPVIVVMHAVSFGLAIDIASVADIRLCAGDTSFCVKEIDIGLAADVGTLSRLPKIGVPLTWAKEVAYTARVFGPEEAAKVGFVSSPFSDRPEASGDEWRKVSKEDAINRALDLAEKIGGKSTVAVQGTKRVMDWSRDHGVDDGLEYVAVWNSAMLQSKDVEKVMEAARNKGKKKTASSKL